MVGWRGAQGEQEVVWAEGDTAGALCTACNPGKVDAAGILEDTREVYHYCTKGGLCCLAVNFCFQTVFIIKRSPQNCCLLFKPTNRVEQQCGPVGADQFKPNAVQWPSS